MKVAVVERKRFGGTCVNNGCIPTKALVASARAAYMARRGGDFGVMIGGDIAVDMAKVKARKDAIVARSTQGVEGWMKGLENATVYEGHGVFEGPRAVRVGDTTIEAGKIFINVGARASTPPIPGIETVPYRDLLDGRAGAWTTSSSSDLDATGWAAVMAAKGPAAAHR